MKYIERKNGFVWLVEEHDEAGKFKTYYNMGKDEEQWDIKEDKPKKTKKESDE